MNALIIRFRSRRFNLSKVGPHFINPCCFGEDVAQWLRPKLAAMQIETSEPYQEDWGWELPATCGDNSYYLCMSGNADREGTDEGEWRIIVEKRRSLWQRLSGKGRIVLHDPMFGMIDQVLAEEPGISNVHRDE